MDFLCVTVIAEFENWFGSAFEIILDIFYKEQTIENPEYLDFKISALDQIAVLIYYIYEFLGHFAYFAGIISIKRDGICKNYGNF